MAHPIPDNALDDRIAIVGTSGSGKTYAAGTMVERLMTLGSRVVVVDPLDVWWGLRAKADGSPSAFPVVIFGGAHGDLPINEHAGALIGETVASMAESCIVSLGTIGTKAAERRFMLTFLTALYRNTKGGLLHLIFDEADMWAPERMLDRDGEAAKLLGQMETVVRRGRVKGFIPYLITQRPAVLSKNVLSQADGLIAMKLTSSQDRAALGAWIEGQADREAGKRILANLPGMQRGHGYVWIPGRGILTTSTFPTKLTFDSSRAPRRGEKVKDAKLRPINLDALKGKLATVEAEAKANDPRALRAEIARLRAAQRQAQPAADPQAEQRAYDRGFTAGGDKIMRAVASLAGDLAKSIARAEEACAGAKRLLTSFEGFLETQATARADVAQPVERLPSKQGVAGSSPAVRSNPAPPPRPTAGTGTLSKAERLVLTALVQYPAGRTKNQVALLSGYAVTGGGFNNALSALRSKGLMTGSGDRLQITPAGTAELGPYTPLPTGAALLQHWYGQLGKAERATLEALAAVWPRALSKEEAASRTGYEASGGGFNNALSRLRTLELISGRGELKASDDLFGGEG